MNKLQQKLDHLKWLKSAGVEYYCSTQKDSKNSLIEQLKQNAEVREVKNSTEELKSIEAPITKKKKAISKTSNIDNAESRKLADKANTITELKEIIEKFEGCELKQFASNMVFADGIEQAPIMLIGEAPGVAEDEQGIPFCGESGYLLDKMLATIGISRQKNAYITNTIFWRPPANRRPTSQEIAICKPFVEKHIALAKPKLIILVGGTAMASLLGKDETISDIRQNNYAYKNQYLSEPIHMTALFHPAYLLRQPMRKKTTWYDLLKMQKFIQENIPEFTS